MHDGANENDPEVVPERAETGPTVGWRAVTLLGIGVSIGLVLGVLVTVGASVTYRFLTPTLPLPTDRDPVQILNELNALRLQVNQLTQEKNLQGQEKDDSLRRALGAVAAAVQARAGASPPAEQRGGSAGVSAARRASDPFAELDAEIKNLEATQAALNAILDLFLSGDKGPAKDRPGNTPPPK
jgi:hypothetical protein